MPHTSLHLIIDTLISTDPILIAGAGGFIGKYLTLLLAPDGMLSDRDITLLGRDPRRHISVDLRTQVPVIDKSYSTVYHLAGSCNSSDAHTDNYITTQNLLKGLDANPPKQLVYLSSTEVYGRSEGENWSEADIVNPTTPVGRAKLATEQMLADWCRDHSTSLTIVRLPAVVGTGMKGQLEDMVKRIWRGTYHHVEGCEARMSVVHATDVARAAVDLASHPGIYNLTDGVNPTRHDFAEALSSRLRNKKIMTLRQNRARRWARINDFIPGTTFTSSHLRTITTSLTFSADKAIATLGWKPQSVVEYLTTHDYDNDPF